MKIDKAILEDLYCNQRLTSVQIAQKLGATSRNVLYWIHAHSIPVREPGPGLANKGMPQPTKDVLIELIHVKHLSYQEVGNMYGVTKEAVNYWMQKFDIARLDMATAKLKDKSQVLPSQEQFLEMYEQGMSIAMIARNIDVSTDALVGFCKRNGITLRKNGWKQGQRYACKDGHEVRSIYEQRVDDWLSEHNIQHEVEPILPFDRRYRADFLANGWYVEIWGVRRNKPYLERKAKKQKQYQEHQLPLIEISEHHFDHRRNNSWQKCLQPLLL